MRMDVGLILGQAEQNSAPSVHMASCLYTTVQSPGTSLAYVEVLLKEEIKNLQTPQQKRLKKCSKTFIKATNVFRLYSMFI
jgi:hypothetical protein